MSFVPPRPAARGRALSPTRAWILELVEGASEPPTTGEVIRATGLHENTVRAHLEALRDRGYLTREIAPTPQRGRPAHQWRAATAASVSASEPRESASTRAYAELTAILTAALGRQSGDPADDARAAGQAWGREHSMRVGTVASLMRTMSELGFAPIADGERGRSQSTISLHACPLTEAVQRDAAIVCAAHRGMIEGMLRTTADAPSTDAPVLIPFSTPGVCTVLLR